MKKPEDFFTIYKQSAWEKDTESMINLYASDVVIFDMWTNGYLTGLAKWSGEINDWLVSLGDERVNVIVDLKEIRESDNVAFGSALITYQAISTDNAIIRSMKNRITLGFIKENDDWKVIHQHTSAPINSDLHAILNF